MIQIVDLITSAKHQNRRGEMLTFYEIHLNGTLFVEREARKVRQLRRNAKFTRKRKSFKILVSHLLFEGSLSNCTVFLGCLKLHSQNMCCLLKVQSQTIDCSLPFEANMNTSLDAAVDNKLTNNTLRL